MVVTGIVERLRSRYGSVGEQHYHDPLYDEAANVIERLNMELAEMALKHSETLRKYNETVEAYANLQKYSLATIDQCGKALALAEKLITEKDP